MSWIDCYVFVRVLVIAFFWLHSPPTTQDFFFAPHLIRSSAIYSSTNVTLVGISKVLSYPNAVQKVYSIMLLTSPSSLVQFRSTIYHCWVLRIYAI